MLRAPVAKAKSLLRLLRVCLMFAAILEEYSLDPTVKPLVGSSKDIMEGRADTEASLSPEVAVPEADDEVASASGFADPETGGEVISASEEDDSSRAPSPILNPSSSGWNSMDSGEVRFGYGPSSDNEAIGEPTTEDKRTLPPLPSTLPASFSLSTATKFLAISCLFKFTPQALQVRWPGQRA